MDKILDGFEILKAENMGLSVNDVINILQKVDNFDTLKTIEGILIIPRLGFHQSAP